jgi:hypothetical protein
LKSRQESKLEGLAGLELELSPNQPNAWPRPVVHFKLCVELIKITPGMVQALEWLLVIGTTGGLSLTERTRTCSAAETPGRVAAQTAAGLSVPGIGCRFDLHKESSCSSSLAAVPRAASEYGPLLRACSTVTHDGVVAHREE